MKPSRIRRSRPRALPPLSIVSLVAVALVAAPPAEAANGALARPVVSAALVVGEPALGVTRWDPPRVASFASWGYADVTTHDSPASRPERSAFRSLLYGTLVGGAGFLMGGYLGSQLSDECDGSGELCIEWGTFLGAAAGGTLGMAAGVHEGNARKGSFGKDLLVATGVWAVGIGVAIGVSSNDDASAIPFFAIPIVQLGLTTAMERSEGRRRAAAGR